MSPAINPAVNLASASASQAAISGGQSLPLSVAVHLTFVKKIFKTAVRSCFAASLLSTLSVYFCISKPKLISAHISSLHAMS